MNDHHVTLKRAIASFLEDRAQEVSAEAYDALVGERVSGEHSG